MVSTVTAGTNTDELSSADEDWVLQKVVEHFNPGIFNPKFKPRLMLSEFYPLNHSSMQNFHLESVIKLNHSNSTFCIKWVVRKPSKSCFSCRGHHNLKP